MVSSKSKTLCFLIVVVLLTNIFALIGLANTSVTGNETQVTKTQEMSITFPEPQVSPQYGYDWLKIDNCSYISTPGYPMLPVKTVTFKIPQDSRVTRVDFETKQSSLLDRYNVLPASIPTSQPTDLMPTPNEEIYSLNIFPKCQPH